MAEYIEREEIYKAVGKLTETFRVNESGSYYAAWRIDEMIGNLPTIDAVSVVRCKDCKNWEDGWVGYCTKCHTAIPYDGYCSYGERKGNAI